MRPASATTSSTPSGFDGDLKAGMMVEHARFGRGEVVNLEGIGGEKKAEIRFKVGGLKKLLLRFAKLKVVE
jgi:DNA helicase-2/ATP-dependent DNA helicase PcrA